MLGTMSGYNLGVGMGGGGGNHNNDAAAGMSGNNNDINSSQTAEKYREFFRNMRNSFPGLGAGPTGGGMGPPPSVGSQNSMPEEFQRMMLARAMGQSGGTRNPEMHHGKKDQGVWCVYTMIVECHILTMIFHPDMKRQPK